MLLPEDVLFDEELFDEVDELLDDSEGVLGTVLVDPLRESVR
ncbi:hypothetical protein [Tersicoccus mangrovi]